MHDAVLVFAADPYAAAHDDDKADSACAILALKVSAWDVVALGQAMPYPYAQAQARYVAGLLLRARGEPEDDEEARRQFTQALAILQRLGERFYAERVAGELTALG